MLVPIQQVSDSVPQPIEIIQTTFTRHHLIHHHPLNLVPLSPLSSICSALSLSSMSLFCFGCRSLPILCFVLTVIESGPWPPRLYGIPYMVCLWPCDLQLRSDSIGWKGPCTLQQSAASQNQEVRGWDLWKWGNRVWSAFYSMATIPSFCAPSGAHQKKNGRKGLRYEGI